MNLPPDQEILWAARPSHFVKVPLYLFAALSIVGLAFAGWALPIYYGAVDLPAPLSQAVGFISLGAWLLSGLITLWVSMVALNHHYTRYVLTSNTLFTRTNFFRGDHDTLWVYLIRDVRAEMPLFLRIFGMGHVVIQGRDLSHPNLVLQGLRDARALKTKLNDMARVQAARNRVLSTGA